MIAVFGGVVIVMALVTAFYAGTIFERSQYIVGEWEEMDDDEEEDQDRGHRGDLRGKAETEEDDA